MSALDILQNETFSSDQLERRARNAEAREQNRIAYESVTVARKCLNCADTFRSEGAHHRLCNRCRSRR